MDAQGTQPRALEDTVYLAMDSAESTDLSQYGTNLTSADLGGYETNSARGAISGTTGRELFVRVALNAADAAVVILSHGLPATSTTNAYMIRTAVAATYDIEFVQGSTTVYAAVNIASKLTATDDVSIHWSTRPNVDTTGPADAVISEFVVWNHSTGGYVLEPTQVTHAASTASATHALSVGGRWDGANLVSDSRQVQRVRIGKSWHSAVEFHEHWVSQRDAPPSDDERIDPLLPLTHDSEIGDESEIVGQANIGWIAEHNWRMRRALWGPLVNEVWTDAEALTTTDDPPQWIMYAPGQETYKMRLDWLRWVSVPPGATHAWVRVHVVSYVTASTSVPIRVRCYAMNRPPFYSQFKWGNLPQLAYSYASSDLLDVDNGSASATGQWLEIGLVKLPRCESKISAWKDTVHLCLAYAFDPAGTSSNDANARLIIDAFHARPVIGPDEIGVGA